MKAVMTYETAPGAMDKARALFPAHRARIDAFHAKGVLLMVGPFADPTQGAMGIFSSREAAEEFMREDPFILEGVVARWTIQDWNEVLA